MPADHQLPAGPRRLTFASPGVVLANGGGWAIAPLHSTAPRVRAMRRA